MLEDASTWSRNGPCHFERLLLAALENYASRAGGERVLAFLKKNQNSIFCFFFKKLKTPLTPAGTALFCVLARPPAWNQDGPDPPTGSQNEAPDLQLGARMAAKTPHQRKEQ